MADPSAITIRPVQGSPDGDPWGAFPDAPPQAAAAPGAQAPPAGDPWAQFPDQPAAPKATRQTSVSEAGVKGLGNALTFGLSPAIAGLAEASGMPSQATNADEIDINPVRPIVGAAKLLHEWLSDHPDEAVKAAYERGRKAQLGDEQMAEEQHPIPYIAGQLVGSLATPLGLGGAAETAAGRIGAGVLAGGIGNGAYSAGDAVSQGDDASTVVKKAAKGAATGAVFGGAAGAGGNVIGSVADKVGSLYRGKMDPDAEAARRVIKAISGDVEKRGPSLSPEEVQVANAAGTPRAIVDTGGENTRALARSAGNTSPDARVALDEVIDPRFQEQGTRIGGYIRNITGGANADELEQTLKNAAKAQNKPAYDRIFAANPVVNVPGEITSRPVVQQAMKDAVSLAKNYGEKLEGAPETKTILQGDGYHIADDIANPGKTSLKYWDYVKKALDARIKKMLKGGGIEELDSKQKADLGGLMDAKNALLAHLDSAAKGYKQVRQGAAAFFGAEDALEAGQNFVMRNANLNEARRAISNFTPAERELFARGFASDLADKLEAVNYNQNVLNSVFLNNGPARQKIYLALGPERARQLETLLRVESVIDKARKAAQGNSSTMRQMAESGLAGGGAVAAYEGLKDHSFDPKAIFVAAIGGAALRHGVKKIDERVATRVGEMLASSDPAVLRKGVDTIQKSPALFDALRAATGAGTRVAAQDIGPERSAAGATALGERIIEGPDDEHGGSRHSDSVLDQLP